MVFYNGQYAPQFQRALQRAREVYELLWGKDSHPIIKHEHGIAFLDPQLAIFNSKPKIIMIRAEYEELWEVIHCARLAQHRLGASQGMVIIGHPGIGKCQCELPTVIAQPAGLTNSTRQIPLPQLLLRKGVTVWHPYHILS